MANSSNAWTAYRARRNEVECRGATSPPIRRARAVSAATGQARQGDLEHAVGIDRVDRVVAMRLTALGLERVLTHVLALGPVGPDWVASLTAQIQEYVP